MRVIFEDQIMQLVAKQRRILFVAWIATACAVGCIRSEEAEGPSTQSPREERATPAAANPPAKSISQISDRPSDSDLSLGGASANVPTVDNAPSDTPPILDDAFEVVERYDDESIQRRWFVRLYVTFDRSKPWHAQAPGSWVEHGEYEEIYPGGEQLLVEGSFDEGKRHGEWTWYHPNGQVAKHGTYQHAQLDGPWNYFREDGTLARTEKYQAHQKNGRWVYYDTDGKTVTRETKYDRGKHFTSAEDEAHVVPN